MPSNTILDHKKPSLDVKLLKKFFWEAFNPLLAILIIKYTVLSLLFRINHFTLSPGYVSSRGSLCHDLVVQESW